MMRQLITAIAALGCLAPAAALAQDQGTLTRSAATAGPQAAGGARRIVSGAVETRITPDRPYSAEAVTESLQVLADGNRITRQTVTRVYRDSMGRTRREMLDENGAVRSIAISDPHAKVSYTLDPATRIAYKSNSLVATVTGRAMRTPEGTFVMTPRPEGAITLERQPVLAPKRGGGGRGGSVATTAVEGQGYATRTRTFEESSDGRTVGMVSATTNREVLGPENIEGVSATGTRSVTVIAPSKVGNTKEIRIVSERWFSDDLQVLVLTRHSDPRSGENTYRLRNILRAEPDPSLFLVPSDYTVQDRHVRRPQ